MQTKNSFFLVLMTLLAQMGCKNGATSKEQVLFDSLTAPEKAMITKQVDLDSQVVKQSNRFAIDFYKKVFEKEKNVILSPYSITSALAMLYAGSAGISETELQEGMYFGKNTPEFHQQMGELQRLIGEAGSGKDLIINIANRFWGSKNMQISSDYSQLLKNSYGSSLKTVDFSGAPDKSREIINTWIENQTNKKIKELLSSNDVSASTEFVLVNAIYFLGTWKNPFPEEATEPNDFTLVDGSQKEVLFMHNPPSETEGSRYALDSLGEWLEMPYKNSSASMVILLPSKDSNLSDVVTSMTVEKVQQGFQKLQTPNLPLSIHIPKWKSEHRIVLNDALSKQGMPKTFGGAADLSKIPAPGLLKAIHQAVIEVNEKGSEAAAVTALIGGRGLMKDISFIANRPFLYFIWEKSTGAILFMGQVVNP